MKEVDAENIPGQWSRLDLSNLKGLQMVVGAPDSGKTTFTKFLCRCSVKNNLITACIDADPGQSRLGPPATMTLKMLNSSNVSGNPKGTWRWFVGSVSPSGHMLQVLTGSYRLLEKARELGAAVVIFDTCGLVDLQKGGGRLKLSKINLLKPQKVFALQRNRELESWLNPLRRSLRVFIEDVECISEKFQRNIDMRTEYRMNRYKQYFSHAKVLELDLNTLAVFFSSNLKPHMLISLEDKNGFTLSLGITIAVEEKNVKVYTPIPENDFISVKSITIGDLMIDPQTFTHQITSP